MGTRHLVAVAVDGEYKVAQYGQYDGYPSGVGVEVLNSIHKIVAGGLLEELMAKMQHTSFVPEHKIKAMEIALNVDQSMEDKFPQFFSRMSSEIIDFVLNQPPGVLLQNSLDFAADSLYCEWVYVLDLDSQCFEVFKGFNTNPLSADERFVFLSAPTRRDNKYHPVSFVAGWDLDALPSSEIFVQQINRLTAETEEEEDCDDVPVASSGHTSTGP